MTHSLTIDPVFQSFIEQDLLPDLGMDSQEFWSGLESIIKDLSPENRRLLETRDKLQKQIDEFLEAGPDALPSTAEYRAFLEHIGYIVPPGEEFRIRTKNIDPEIATIAGPQLVVPVNNARFALNAANARWGSLYDALYGTNVIPDSNRQAVGKTYNPIRGDAVIRHAIVFLDQAVPLVDASHAEVLDYQIEFDKKSATLVMKLANGMQSFLSRPEQFSGYREQNGKIRILLVNNGLHIELKIDRDHPVGKQSSAGVWDIDLESAVTTIQDCEDSVAAVDAEDKVGVYRNWLGLMRGELSATFTKGDRELTRNLNPDREYVDPAGRNFSLPGRSLMLVRNVGHLMTNDAVCDDKGKPVFEGILDAVVTSTCALADLQGRGAYKNSQTGSIYIVKPKMHGPDEVAFTNTLFGRVESMLGLEPFTIKVGVMDEERRTTVNLAECIRAVQDRLVFINTGFLDRTGDEIHTSMHAAPMLPKEQIKQAVWIDAYEDWNVDIGIRCGLPGKAQIGKGMWAKPDEMKEMVDTKAAHPRAGANCAWVPSPTAATLHALHYHEINVAIQQQLIAKRPLADLNDILTPPYGDVTQLDDETIQSELNNNAQGILGYVVRWIDHGVGCSKVPDIHDVGLMEDRATLRISSQHIANWLRHNICSQDQVLETFKRMAVVVDQQNADDPFYQSMAADFEANIAFRAACDLVLEGCEQPSGYTEPLLHEYRRLKKRE